MKVVGLRDWAQRRNDGTGSGDDCVWQKVNVRLLGSKEKQAVLLAFLLSEGIKDEQLNAMIEAVTGKSREFGGRRID